MRSTVAIVGAPVWGTFSVRDHTRHTAFLREALLFDRLLVPYPDPQVVGEWERWQHPNKNDPTETWDPDRLDRLLTILGTEEEPGHNGARLVQRSMWSQPTWQMLQSRLEVAEAATGDPFMDTRLALTLRGEHRPVVVEAVAAYPSEQAWRGDVQPVEEEPAEMSAMDAMVQLPRPLLLPPEDVPEDDALRAVVELAQDPEFQQARVAYFEWFRDFIEPLRRANPEATLDQLKLDAGSMNVAKEQLNELWQREREVARRGDRARWFSRLEIACVSLGAAGSVGLALAAALPAIGVPVALASFVGWAAARRAKPKEPRNLGGASVFVDVHRRLGWLDPLNT
jgi:hypothetical protein